MKQQLGRVVVITGAAGGIGRALVDLFATGGDTVVAVDLPDSGVLEMARHLGYPHLCLECDVSREEDILSLYRRIEERFLHIDVLVNNAAVGPDLVATSNTHVEDFQLALRVNLVGPNIMARETARRMKPGGVIANVASVAGLLANPHRNAYAASKAGLIAITKVLACEWAPRGIRVCAVAPGYVRTPMIAELERAGKIRSAQVRSCIPMGRMARPDEVARAVRFMVSVQAAYITGSTLVVDGGLMSFNQPGEAHPTVDNSRDAEPPRRVEGTHARIAVVIGGAKGIGAAVVRRFAERGDTVVIADKNGEAAADLASSLGDKHLAISADVTRESEVVALFDELRQCYGHIDILVNCAAPKGAFVPSIEDVSQVFEQGLSVNLTGAFTCAREAIKVMRPGSVILNLGACADLLRPASRHTADAYNAAIEMLTRCMAAELGPFGVRTATIVPGHIRTLGVTHWSKFMSRWVARQIPMGRLGEPEEVADAACFLASADASYITGSILNVDGGLTSNFGPRCVRKSDLTGNRLCDDDRTKLRIPGT
ncbi:SDR family oxidoreductase [Rhizobium johnstonii]|uniref:SDR family oxidoreductase n=1 Tax=Rhizobium TaxID=379 RepID=UPI0010314908|nr:SDR family oxidoreductase [Rhizobium leguminosarum]TBF43764.1 SDR family oxidoreductase [Rhizobium leguminosarum]TBG08396.1 SDR family oxidoreductase [Rhizobium leguminosarum]TBG28552.1 SDR family oxidoreductase [Rhizobium leguminosarum]TBG51981.1 SDR family oxidoreductase [Rhizobium leguminosarum]TBG71271.1 SDR family oxidoreductase [Rhizobium leguminosarum]